MQVDAEEQEHYDARGEQRAPIPNAAMQTRVQQQVNAAAAGDEGRHHLAQDCQHGQHPRPRHLCPALCLVSVSSCAERSRAHSVTSSLHEEGLRRDGGAYVYTCVYTCTRVYIRFVAVGEKGGERLEQGMRTARRRRLVRCRCVLRASRTGTGLGP